MDEYELARRAYVLPDTFADRLDPADLGAIREFAEVGEWGEEIDLLLASLESGHQRVTANERSDLIALLTAMGLPTGPAEKLHG